MKNLEKRISASQRLMSIYGRQAVSMDMTVWISNRQIKLPPQAENSDANQYEQVVRALIGKLIMKDKR